MGSSGAAPRCKSRPSSHPACATESPKDGQTHWLRGTASALKGNYQDIRNSIFISDCCSLGSMGQTHRRAEHPLAEVRAGKYQAEQPQTKVSKNSLPKTEHQTTHQSKRRPGEPPPSTPNQPLAQGRRCVIIYFGSPWKYRRMAPSVHGFAWSLGPCSAPATCSTLVPAESW